MKTVDVCKCVSVGYMCAKLQKPLSHSHPHHLELVSSAFKLYPDVTATSTTKSPRTATVSSAPSPCLL